MTYTEDEGYRPPLPSEATIKPAARSKSSGRGFLHVRFPGSDRLQQIYYHSLKERAALLLMLTRADVRRIEDQPRAVKYLDGDGKQKRAVFDYRLFLQSGETVAVAVKPEARVRSLRFRQTLGLIAAQLPHNFADRVELFTDRHIHPSELQNAELLHLFRRSPDVEADARIASLIETGVEARTVADIVELSGLGTRAFRAVFRAIYAGLIDAERQAPITMASPVVLVGECNGA